MAISHLLEQVRERLRARHYALRTEQAYLHWIHRFILFHNQRHPGEMNSPEIQDFLTHLAVNRNAAAATQNQAHSALLFLYRHVLHQPLIHPIDALRARRPTRLPTVITRHEVQCLLDHLSGTHRLMAMLLYGSGLRLMECVRLRVQDLDFERHHLTVRDSRGQHDRLTMLPARALPALQAHLQRTRSQHQADLALGAGSVFLPEALARRYPNASREWAWQYVFPSSRLSTDPRSGQARRHHVSESGLQKAVRQAALAASLPKRVSCQTLRHSFASHLLGAGYDIHTVQELLGHKHVKTTRIYTHLPSRGGLAVHSPLDGW